MTKRHVGGWVVLCVLALIMSGCFFEFFAWSPDGRYLFFAGEGKNELWRWDSQTRLPEKITFKAVGNEDIGKIAGCHILPAGNKILLVTDKDDNIYLGDLSHPDQCKLIAPKAAPYYDVTPSGKIYTITKNEKEGNKTWSIQVFDDDRQTTVWTTGSEIGFPRLAPSGKQLLYMGENCLASLDLDSRTTRSLIANKKMNYLWPSWLDEGHLIFVASPADDKDDMIGQLQVLSIDDATTRALCDTVAGIIPYSLSADRRTVAVTAMRYGRESGKKNYPMDSQIATIDLGSGEKKWLTDEDFGASRPAYSPDGKWLAYKGLLTTVIDLKTGQITIAWTDEDQRQWAAAETLVRAGEAAQAVDALKALLMRFPEDKKDTNLPRDIIYYRLMTLALNPPLYDLDKAYEMLKKIGDKDIAAQALDLFWRAQDLVATDPANDWITTYMTEASMKEWKVDTDLTRDLRRLWVRPGKERIYVRVEYGSDKDLSGIALQDTLLLFKEDGARDTTQTQISPHAIWEHTAQREVLIRHWLESGENSQYDLEIKNANGEMVHRFLASGFAPPCDTLFDSMGTISVDGKPSSVCYAISRKVLGIPEGRHKIDLQVCTMKGGIETRKGQEKPVGAGCDIADAYGEENTAARIKSEEGANPGKPCVIKGYAGTFEVE